MVSLSGTVGPDPQDDLFARMDATRTAGPVDGSPRSATAVRLEAQSDVFVSATMTRTAAVDLVGQRSAAGITVSLPAPTVQIFVYRPQLITTRTAVTGQLNMPVQFGQQIQTRTQIQAMLGYARPLSGTASTYTVVSGHIRPLNDNFANAQWIWAGGTVTGTTADTTVQSGEVGNFTAWYKWVAPFTSNFSLTLTTPTSSKRGYVYTRDTSIAPGTADAISNITPVGYLDSSSGTNTTTYTAGVVYYFQVFDYFYETPGDFTLDYHAGRDPSGGYTPVPVTMSATFNTATVVTASMNVLPRGALADVNQPCVISSHTLVAAPYLIVERSFQVSTSDPYYVTGQPYLNVGLSYPRTTSTFTVLTIESVASGSRKPPERFYGEDVEEIPRSGQKTSKMVPYYV